MVCYILATIVRFLVNPEVIFLLFCRRFLGSWSTKFSRRHFGSAFWVTVATTYKGTEAILKQHNLGAVGFECGIQSFLRNNMVRYAKVVSSQELLGFYREYRQIFINSILDLPPPPSNCNKWRFRLRFPTPPKKVIISSIGGGRLILGVWGGGW